MATESLTPPPASGGGNAKYLIVLLLLLGGGLGVFLATRKAEPPAAAAAPAPPKVERPTALADEQLEIPVAEEEEPPAVPEVLEEKKPRKGVSQSDGWSCEGDVPAQEIRTVLADRQTQVRSCYERRLRVNNMLQGSVNLQVKIGNDGKVVSSRVRGNLHDDQVKECIQEIAKKWTFPPPTGGSCAVFDAPYNFTPKN